MSMTSRILFFGLVTSAQMSLAGVFGGGGGHTTIHPDTGEIVTLDRARQKLSGERCSSPTPVNVKSDSSLKEAYQLG